MRFEIYVKRQEFDPVKRNFNERWYWRLRARNGKIVADGSEGYNSERNVRRAIWGLEEAFLYRGEIFPVVKVSS